MVSTSELIRYCFVAILVVVLGVFIGLTLCTIYNTQDESFTTTIVTDSNISIPNSVQPGAGSYPNNVTRIIDSEETTDYTNSTPPGAYGNVPLGQATTVGYQESLNNTNANSVSVVSSNPYNSNTNDIIDTPNVFNMPVAGGQPVYDASPSTCSSVPTVVPPAASTLPSNSNASNASCPQPQPPNKPVQPSCPPAANANCPKPVYCPPCPKCPKPCPRMCPDMSKYVLKTSIPPCPQANVDLNTYMLKSDCNMPDMTKYVRKSSLPSRNHTPCPPCVCQCGDGKASSSSSSSSGNAGDTGTRYTHDDNEEDDANDTDNNTATKTLASSQSKTELGSASSHHNNNLLGTATSSKPVHTPPSFGGLFGDSSGSNYVMGVSGGGASVYASSNITGSCGDQPRDSTDNQNENT